MAEEVGTRYALDITAVNAAFDKMADRDVQFRAAVQQTGAAARSSFQEAAQQALAYQQRLQQASAEVRQAGAVYNELRGELRRAAEEGKTLEKAFRDAGSASTAAGQRIRAELEVNKRKQAELKTEIDLTRKAIDDERSAVVKVKTEQQQQVAQQRLVAAAARDAAKAEREAAAGAKEAAAATKQAAAAAKEQAGATGQAGGAVAGLKGAFAAAGGLAAGLFAVDKAIEFGKNVVSTRAEFERLENVLTNTFGGDRGKAQQALATVATFARDTGQNVTDVTGSFLTLVNRGIEPTRRQLEQLSDVAVTSRKSVDQYVEAIVDAQQGQFERLTEFGVKAKASGDKVTFTFKGVTTEVKNSTDAIAEYLFGLGDVAGVMGATQSAADGFTGSAGRLSTSLTELFDVLGDGTNGPLAAFIQRITRATRSVTEFFKSTDRKAVEAASQGIQDYAGIADQVFKQAADSAEKGGKDRNAALQAAFEQQDRLLEQQQQRAAARAKAIQDFQAAGAPVDNPLFAEFREDRSILEGFRVQKEALLTAQTRLKLTEGERRVLKERFDIALKGGSEEINQLGVIEQLRKKIKQEQEELEKLKQGPRFETQRKQLVATIKADNEELERLLGKQKAQRKGVDYLKQLLAEEERLRKDANQKELQLVKDGGEAKAAEQLRQSLEEIDRTEQKLKELEKLAGRDGVIDGVQAQELAALRAAASDTYFQELTRIALEYNQRLFDLQAESDQKELTAINRKYDKLVDAARTGEERLALETARARELQATRQQQEQRQIEEAATLRTNSVRAGIGEVFGTGTGQSVIEAKKREKEELLRIDLEKNEALLNNSLLLAGREGEIVRSALRLQIAELKNGIRQVNEEKGKLDPRGAVYRLVLGENDSEETRAQLDKAVQDATGAISQLLAADLQLQQAKIDARTRTIDDLNTRLSQEIQLNKEGSASNIGTLKAQIAEEKAARREAVAERKKAAREQIVLDTLLQSSNVITAASQALTAFPIPFVGPALGIAAASLIVGAFVASKVKAFQAVNAQSEGFFKGGYTGDGHNREEAGPVHRREFVMKEDLTTKYRGPLFEALHAGRPQDIDWQAPQMRELLPDFSLPEKLRSERAAVVEHRHQVAYAPLQAGLEGLQREIGEMKQHTARLPTEQYVNNPDGTLTVIDLLTGNKTTYRSQ